jgi:NAD(P)-dependent dehydrogenase (short-subunit alcohol dehydrogenase family)
MSGRTIIITGASDGIGAAAARTLSAAGERVVAAGRNAGKSSRLAAGLQAPALHRCHPAERPVKACAGVAYCPGVRSR